jgi:hypothetical protein
MERDDDEERVDEGAMKDVPQSEQVARPLQVGQTTGQHRPLRGTIHDPGECRDIDSSLRK